MIPSARCVFFLTALGSFGAAYLLTCTSPQAAFYLMPPRLWQLASGALLYEWQRRKSLQQHSQQPPTQAEDAPHAQADDDPYAQADEPNAISMHAIRGNQHGLADELNAKEEQLPESKQSPQSPPSRAPPSPPLETPLDKSTAATAPSRALSDRASTRRALQFNCAAELSAALLLACSFGLTSSASGYPMPGCLPAVAATVGLIALGTPSLVPTTARYNTRRCPLAHKQPPTSPPPCITTHHARIAPQVPPRSLCTLDYSTGDDSFETLRVPSPLLPAFLRTRPLAYLGRLSCALYLARPSMSVHGLNLPSLAFAPLHQPSPAFPALPRPPTLLHRYALYLTHWPIFVLFRWTPLGLRTLSSRLAALALSFVTSAAVHHLCDKPPPSHSQHYLCEKPPSHSHLSFTALIDGSHVQPLPSHSKVREAPMGVAAAAPLARARRSARRHVSARGVRLLVPSPSDPSDSFRFLLVPPDHCSACTSGFLPTPSDSF